jgi:multiple sugar transport system permease protein/cellobiose transport system permease protein
VGFIIEMKNLHWLGTHLPIIIPPAANAFGVYWMRQYARSFIPSAVIESARIDGSGEAQTFFRIVIPMCKPAVVTLAILSFVASWNSYLTPLVAINQQKLYTMPIAIAGIGSLFHAEYAAQIMALTVGTIPILTIFSLSSKYFIQGLSVGAVKG